jgi:hypothetical protein
MISPKPGVLNNQERAGTLKILQDYQYTNVFILKSKTVFTRMHPVKGFALSSFLGENHMTEKETPPDSASSCITPAPAGDTSSSEFSGGITLERILDETDEMDHLNQFILLHVENCGGFTTPEAYFSLVQPVLDLLEVEIRVRYWPGMTKTEMKLVVQDWIDSEIALLHKGK